MPEETPHSRTERKRQAIMEAATTVFLRSGYLGASMDEIAALAAVSKQTVYKHFVDKESLFAAIIRATAAGADELDQVAGDLARRGSGDLAKDLQELARWLLTFLMRPQVRQLRRLVIGEAGRFPELGRAWYAQAFNRGVTTLASYFAALAERGELRLDDPARAAEHFAGMILWVPMNRLMFCGDDEHLTDTEVDQVSEEGVRAFLAAYGRE